MSFIVYPDANRPIAALLSGRRRRALDALGGVAIHLGRPRDDDEFVARIGEARALLLGWDLPAAVMARAGALELISFVGIGAGNFVDLAGAAARGITVCNTPGYADDTVAEHALALMLAAARHVVRLDRDLRAGRWNQSVPGFQLGGKRLGLVGYGGIGARLGALARGLGMTVRAWTRRPDPARAHRDGIEFLGLDELLRSSDVVSLHVALTEETTGLIGARALALLPSRALLVNTARGAVVDEAALVAALAEGRLAAAGLDVYAEEPLPAASPLLALDNVVLSPHVAFNTPEATEAMIDIAVDNVVRYFAGDPVNVVAAP